MRKKDAVIEIICECKRKGGVYQYEINDVEVKSNVNQGARHMQSENP